MRALPPFNASLHQSTGAPGHLFEVKTPAAVLPGDTSIITKSVRSWYRIPAAVAPSRTPANAGRPGKGTASGETDAVMVSFPCRGYCLAGGGPT